MSFDDEIEDTDESINKFCDKLEKIIKFHLFLKKLNKDYLKKEDAINIIKVRCEDISNEIKRISNIDQTRDNISRKIINGLYDLCYATLILNATRLGYDNVNERLAWELSQLDIKTRYLSDFLKGIKYVGSRIPAEGQSERLMLKYYNYLWEIKNFLKEFFNIKVLNNLKEFPLNTDKIDEEYYKMIASNIDEIELSSTNPSYTRYYIKKKTPFFVNGERYFEITLQLAELYATKFNRITVYTKMNISTNYSIQIAYSTAEINLWGVNSYIKVVTNWKVSISPVCLNKLAKILKIETKLNTNYNEYDSLMSFLTSSGMNLYDLINLETNRFRDILNNIYGNSNTKIFKNVLIFLKNNFAASSNVFGRYTIRYILLNLHEEIIESVIATKYDKIYLSSNLNITSKCFPFEKNPFISNLAGRKTSKGSMNDIVEITNDEKRFNVIQPYIILEKLIRDTGELYFNLDSTLTETKIQKYNNSLDSWEENNGYSINQENGVVSIASYENTTLFILEKLLNLSKNPNRGQKEFNAKYLRECKINFEDPLKKIALNNVFVKSQLMLIYGAAGTGKTTLINYISNMMNKSKKLFLTKTHTALQNLKRRIENPGINSDFISIDSFTKKITLSEYDLIFIDECSTIDNRTMKVFLEKIDNNTLLVLAGDIYQIESIDFGNWFYYAKNIINTEGSNIELLNTWRTDREELKSLWNAVRLVNPIITEKLAMDGPFSENLGKEIFSKDEDEIVLCLNYDGKFGLNNMNLYFQNANPNKEVYTWAEWSFKVGDPVIFLDTKRSSLLYNNLKGQIVDISKKADSITFTLDIDTILTSQQCKHESFKFIDIINSKTRIQLTVTMFYDSMTEEERINTIIPFQIAYAISIHKAQGLEYNSVKIVIPSYNAEKITHSIFYTAITRTKEKLKIFWSAETMNAIVKSFSDNKVEQKSLALIKDKLNRYKHLNETIVYKTYNTNQNIIVAEEDVSVL